MLQSLESSLESDSITLVVLLTHDHNILKQVETTNIKGNPFAREVAEHKISLMYPHLKV